MSERALPPLSAPRRNIWMRGTHRRGRCSCGEWTYNRMICWDAELRITVRCWSCCPAGNRPDPTKFPLLRIPK